LKLMQQTFFDVVNTAEVAAIWVKL
jgi:hypothetical protein